MACHCCYLDKNPYMTNQQCGKRRRRRRRRRRRNI
jgi:hypothetical protein